MNQSKPKPKTVCTLSVRLPPDLYNQIAEKALATGDTLNGVFIQVVRDGLSKQNLREAIIQDFIFEVVPRNKLKELIDGKVTT